MKKYIFGVDVGGTAIKLGMFDKDARLIEKYEFGTPKENPRVSLVNAVRDNILTLLSKHSGTAESIIGIGLGAPGLMNYDGYITTSPNLDLYDCNPAKDLSLLLNVPVFSANDGHLASLGEFSFGAGRGAESIMMITLGTGLGSGTIINGRLLRNSRGGVGEIGHITVNDDESELCGCGKRGCLEQYASATGIVRLARRALNESDEPSILRDSDLSAKSVFDAVKANDKLALSVIDRFSYYLGRGLATVATVISPDTFIIGGGVSKAGSILIDLIKPYYLKYAHKASAGAILKLAELGNDAGIYGCAQLVLDNV